VWTGTKRQRLEGRLNRLTQLYGWGELEADDYRRQMTETRAMLAELPDPDKLVAFDRCQRRSKLEQETPAET